MLLAMLDVMKQTCFAVNDADRLASMLPAMQLMKSQAQILVSNAGRFSCILVLRVFGAAAVC